MFKNKSIATIVGTVFVASISTAGIANAAENPFSAKTLNSGYQVADNHKNAEGKCGTGKCGATSKSKAKEASCGAEKDKEGSCSAEKAKEGSCGSEKGKEGSCGSK